MLTPTGYLHVLLALVLYPLVRRVVLGYGQLPTYFMHHDRNDMFGVKLEQRLQRLDRRLGSRWALPGGLTLLLLITGPALHWGTIDPGHSLRLLVGFVHPCVCRARRR